MIESEVTKIVKWLYKYGYFKDQKKAETIISKLEYIDEEVNRLEIDNFNYIGILDIIRKAGG